jgi:ComF family protein
MPNAGKMERIIRPEASLSNFTTTILNSCINIMQSVLPQDCMLCGAAAGRDKLCQHCRADLPYHRSPSCPICAIPSTDGCVCGHCLSKPPAYGATLAAFIYTFPLDGLVQSLKYGGNLALTDVLTEPLIAHAATGPKPDLLIPLPLHPAKLRERGFNQSLEIARLLSRALNVPLATDACERVRDTAPQASLPLKHRHDNVKGAFACYLDLSGKHVAVVDDVMTTGATLDEMAKILLKAGAASVSNWVVARALPHR